MARGDKGPLHHPHPAARLCSGMIVFPTVAAFEGALHTLPVPAEAAIAVAMARQASLTKPAGLQGQLEEIALFKSEEHTFEIHTLIRVSHTVYFLQILNI